MTNLLTAELQTTMHMQLTYARLDGLVSMIEYNCPQCQEKAMVGEIMCHTCGYDLVELDEGNDPYGRMTGDEQSSPSMTLTFTIHPACDSVSYHDEKIITLCDELVLHRLGMTTCGSEIVAINPSALAIADEYISMGMIMPVKVKSIPTKRENNMKTINGMTLEEMMIAMVDSDTLDVDVALNIQKAMDDGVELEGLLISYLDSDGIDLISAQQLFEFA